MANSAILLLKAVTWHLGQLLSFRHDGRELEQLENGWLVHLSGLKLILAGLVVAYVMPEIGVGPGVFKALVSMAMLYAFAAASGQLYAFTGYLLVGSGIDVGMLALHLAVGQVTPAFMTTCYIWGFSAFLVMLLRAAVRSGSAGRKSTSC